MDKSISNLHVIGAFVASALAKVDPDGKSPAAFRDCGSMFKIHIALYP